MSVKIGLYKNMEEESRAKIKLLRSFALCTLYDCEIN
jgi:hypothetical protein